MKPTDDLLTAIARKHLAIATLERRNSDSLDFHHVAVWAVRSGLLAAYEAGASDSTAKPGHPSPATMRAALQLASNYLADDLDEDDETEMRVFNAIRAALGHSPRRDY
jgi:Family of unknown function (DUF6900)